jgi:ring-1,2-phenylacetyl-CoA epoxidase subunit PaaB
MEIGMRDTQWPRFQVFVQAQEGEPHLDAGSVHAPDPEMALLNARDVFVRRPACTSLWLVRAEAISARNAGAPFESDSEREIDGELRPYHIFRKLKPAASLSEAGLVTARSAQEALDLAIAHFSATDEPGEQASVWWAFPAEAVLHSQPDDRESLFQPALDKPFRLSTDFKTHTLMRQIKQDDRSD